MERLAKRMDTALAFAKIAEAIEELTMVGRQDHDLRVVTAQYRLFEPLPRQVAFFAIELGQILNEDGQASIGKAQLLDIPLARPNLLVSTNSGCLLYTSRCV